MPRHEEEDIYRLMSGKRVASVLASVLAVLLIVGSACTYIIPEIHYLVPFGMSLAGFILLVFAMIMAMLEKVRHTRMIDASHHPDED